MLVQRSPGHVTSQSLVRCLRKRPQRTITMATTRRRQQLRLVRLATKKALYPVRTIQ